MFLDSEGTVMYVGKSKCLRKRVASYFGKLKHEKLNVMLRFADSIVIEETGTDIEALLLEHELIKKFRPQYNEKMRKDYQSWYIKISDGLLITLDADLAGFTMGPFSHKEAAMEVIEVLGKCFKLPTCCKAASQVARMCLRGHMKNCIAPCENKEAGMETYQNAINFLLGGQNETFGRIQDEMLIAAGKMEFERAARLKDLHEGLKRLSGYGTNTLPSFANMRFVVFLKSYHEDCFMLAYLDDGVCLVKVIINGIHETDKIQSFAKGILALCKQPPNGSSEDNRAFVRALVEISALRRFYQIDAEIACATALLQSIKEMIE